MIVIVYLLAFFASNALAAEQHVVVSIPAQKLYLKNATKTVKVYSISTSGYGIGNTKDSNHTPLGKHKISAKIGTNKPIGTIFKGGVATSRKAPIYTKSVPMQQQEDLITTRILQLQGLEKQNSNSAVRGIWVHGTPYHGNIGSRCSHGCIRMKNNDIIDLFDRVTTGCILTIVNQ